MDELSEPEASMAERAAALEKAMAEIHGAPTVGGPTVSAPADDRPSGVSRAGAYVPQAAAEPKPELVPVPASVFDDDFFRKPNEELRSATTPGTVEESNNTVWPEAKVPTFAGYAAEAPAEVDELDIPAFLRRNH
jgi:cell division protein FtsZ